MIDGHPRVTGETLYKGNKKLDAAIPVSKEENCKHKLDNTSYRFRCIEELGTKSVYSNK